MSRTNPIPPGTQNVSVNMPDLLAEKLTIMAKRSGVSRSKYCAMILQEAAEAGALLQKHERVVYPEREGQSTVIEESSRRPLGKSHKKLAG